MADEWVCFKCSTHNEMGVRFCVSCGAQRPLAAGAFVTIGENGGDLELPPDAMQNAEAANYQATPDVSAILEQLLQYADAAAIGQLAPRKFLDGIYQVFASVDKMLANLRERSENVSGPDNLERALKMSLGDVEYLFRLALMQFEGFKGRSDCQALRVGMLLSEKAVWSCERLQKQLDCVKYETIRHDYDLIGQTLCDLADGELTDEEYAAKLKGNEAELREELTAARRMLDDGLAMAAKFDGREHRTLMRSTELLRQSSESLGRLIMALQPVKIVKRMKQMEAEARANGLYGGEEGNEAQ